MKFLPDSVSEPGSDWLVNHPRVFTGAILALVAFHLWGLYDCMKLYHQAKNAIGEVQKAASEGLGG